MEPKITISVVTNGYTMIVTIGFTMVITNGFAMIVTSRYNDYRWIDYD